jgi:diguanylate cyclase (GGDEF)-like protein
MTDHRLAFFISIVATALIGYIDYQTGTHVSMLLLYAVPVLATSWYCGKSEGIVVAACATIGWFIVNVANKHPDEINAIIFWNAFTRFGILALIALTVSLQAQLRLALERERLRADTDRLTGLYNSGAFRERVEEEIHRALRYHHPITLAFIDLDNFKQVNDTEGHARGDKLLKNVSESIMHTIRETDIPGRIGGDEFTICFPETGEVQARNAIANLVKALDIMTCQSGWQVTASIGVVTCIECCDTYDSLLGKADKLMYIAKENGKNSAEFMTVPEIQAI